MKCLLYTVRYLGQRLSAPKIQLNSLVVLLFLYSSVMALPKFVVNSNHWDEKATIFLANSPEQACSGEQIRLLTPKTQWMPNNQILDLAWVGPAKVICPKTDKICLDFYHKMASRKSVIYGISATEEASSILYQFDAESGEELGSISLSLPLTTAFLLVEEVYFENAWHTFLMCATSSSDLPSQVFIWDVTDPASRFNKPLSLESLAGLAADPFKITARPSLLRYREGHFGLALPGQLTSIAGLYLISLQHLPKAYFLKTGSIPLMQVQAIDSNMQGYVDKLYLVDEQGVLSSVELEKDKVGPVTKALTGLDPHFSSVTVLKSIQQPGIDLYYFGEDLEGKRGIFKRSEGAKGLALKKQRIVSGDFVGLWPRLGSLILIQQSSSKWPLVLSRSYSASEQPVLVTWKKLLSAKDEAAILQTLLLWDPHQQLDTLITLNARCQVTVLQAAITRDHYGRVTWRRGN